MKLFIHFDKDGQILSVAKVHLMEHEGHHPFIHAEKSEQVIEVAATRELKDLDAHEIAEQYMIDITSRVLRKKQEAGTVKRIETRKKPRGK